MTYQLPSFRQVILISAGWWLSWTLMQTIIIYRLGFDWKLALADSGISNGLLAISVYAMTNSLRFYQPGSRSYFYLLAWSGSLALACVFMFRWIMLSIFDADTIYLQFLELSISARYGFALLMITCMNLICWIYYNFKAQQESEGRKTDAEKLVREAELSRLRQQLQPHFLFNSLNSISALAGSRPEEARKMIQQLSDFLRGTLRKDEQQLVSLKDELEHLQLYLEIEKVRFGHRLDTRIESEQAAEGMLLPSLLLQPVVENAIKFGLYDTVGDICIRITASAGPKQLVIQVENPFDQSTAQPQQGTGFGLSSVQRRLHLLFARNDLLQTAHRGNLFITTITIPQSS